MLLVVFPIIICSEIKFRANTKGKNNYQREVS